MPKYLLILILLLASVPFCRPAAAGVYNLHLATDNVPDYTDLPSLVESATGNWQTPQDKCIAIWRWGRRARHCASPVRRGPGVSASNRRGRSRGPGTRAGEW